MARFISSLGPQTVDVALHPLGLVLAGHKYRIASFNDDRIFDPDSGYHAPFGPNITTADIVQ